MSTTWQVVAGTDSAATASEIKTVANNIDNVKTVGDNSANVTTVAGISSNVTTVAGIASNVTTVATNNSNVNTVAGISSNVTSVAGVASLITSDFASDLNTLATSDIVADLNTLATADIVTDLNTLATSANVTNMATLGASGVVANIASVAGVASNVATVAGIASNVTTVAGVAANVTTVASNVTDVNNFANRYRIGSSDPTSSLDEGDLAYNTTDNALKYYTGSSWSSITAGLTDIVGDVTPQLGGNLDCQTNNITNLGTLNTHTVQGGTGTIALTSDITVSASSTTTFTNKTFDANGTGNALSNVEVADLASGVLDTDISSVSGSDDTLASAKAIKTYVDAQVTAQDLDFEADSGGALAIDLDSEALTFTGGTGIDTSGSGNAVTFAIDNTVVTTTGSQTLTNKSGNISMFTNDSNFITSTVTGDFIVDTDTLKVDSTNNRVGIGQATPLKQFEINNSGNTEFLIKSGTSSVGKILFGDASSLSAGLIEYGHAANDMGFYVNDSRKVLIESDGDLHVDGDVIAYSTTVPSDVALKTDIEMIPNALDKIDEVKGVTFKRYDGEKSAGVIAQDLEKVLPEAVHEKKFKLLDGKKYKTVQYDAIHGLLINCIKELKEEIKELKNGFTK
tara:strand:- start:3464 stop:5344 length:1881 start_codon:yes stop_codon:yes gene_type:complete